MHQADNLTIEQLLNTTYHTGKPDSSHVGQIKQFEKRWAHPFPFLPAPSLL